MTEADLADKDPLRDESHPEDEIWAAAEEQAQAEESKRAADAGGSGNDELRAAQDRVLRAQAELENFRKRARREMDEERRYANLPLIHDMLSVLDNLDRAMESADQHEGGGASLLTGVQMVAEQLRGVLEKYHCQPIPALGETFDPNLHEAVGQEPTNEYDAGQVSRVLRSGYRLHDRVIRPSQVLIAIRPPVDAGSPTQAE